MVCLVYNAVNRLTSVNDGVSITTYTYSGDGDRVSQTVDGVTTTYVIDIAAPLTMILAETTWNETGGRLASAEHSAQPNAMHGLNLIGQSASYRSGQRRSAAVSTNAEAGCQFAPL